MAHNIYEYTSGSLWKDENFDFSNARTTSGDAPDLVAMEGSSIEVAVFDGSNTTEEVSIVKELNHDYQHGTPLSFHVHWMPTTTGAGTVRWNVDYKIKHPTTSTTISGTISATDTASGVAWKLQTTDLPDIDLGVNALIGAQIHFRFYRNPALDTYPADAALSTMGYHYLTNSRGSSQRTSK
jgi:hypothetical protein